MYCSASPIHGNAPTIAGGLVAFFINGTAVHEYVGSGQHVRGLQVVQLGQHVHQCRLQQQKAVVVSQ